MANKYELTSEFRMVFNKKIYRIKALVDFGTIRAGDLGGFIEKESNLSDSGDAWVSDNAWVIGSARVYDNAKVSGDAWVSGRARVFGEARVYGDARISGDSLICGNANVSGYAKVSVNALVASDFDYLVVQRIGPKSGNLTAFKTRSGEIIISIGCFTGTLEEFEIEVNENHNNDKYAKTYKLVIEMVKSRLLDESNDENK